MNSNRKNLASLTVMSLGILTVLVLPAQASTTGQLSGYVVDNHGTPLPGVTVTASSPTQIGGVQATQTDAQGWFQYPRLNPGYFKVRLELDEFLTQELTEVQVRLDRMTQVHITMPPATFGGTITVTETTPVVDPQQVSTGQTFTSDFIQEAAIGNDFRYVYWQMVLQAAGTSGSHPGGESGDPDISVLGSTPNENIFRIDGLDTTHPYWGSAQITLPLDSIQEVAFESGGFGAEYGRATGGVINALTKSGSNVFSGTFDARYGDNDLETSGDHYDPDEQISSSRIVAATLGGRLVRDRSWFFGSLESQSYEDTPTGAPTTYQEDWYQGFLKITGQVTPSWLALGKYHRSPWEVLNGFSSQFVAPEATARLEEDQSILQAEVSGVLTQNLMWELQMGTQLVEEDWGPMSGDNSAISHYNLATGMRSGNYSGMIDRDTGRDQVGTQLTWFVDDALGSHEIKLGGEYLNTSLDQQSCYSGLAGGGFCRAGEQGYEFFDLIDDDGTNIPFLMDAITAAGPYEVVGRLPALYFHDSWRLRPNLSLQLGLRWDRAIYDNDAGEEVANLEMLQPRLGVTWDLTRNGRNLLRASWGRYMHSSFLRLPRLSTTVAEPWETWLSCSLEGLPDSTLCAEVAAMEGLAWRADPEGWDPAGWLLVGSGTEEPSRVDPNLEPQYSDTLILGFERELFRRTSLELSFVDKATRDVLDDTCSENIPTPTPEWNGECSYFVIANLPQARRDYKAWILNFESRALDRIHVLASYTNSESKGSTLSSAAGWEFDVSPYHFENLYGYLPYHRKHRVKASGYVFMPLDFGVGFSGVWGSPFRWTPQLPGPLVANGLWHQVFVEPRGSREGDEWTQLNVQLTKAFNVGRVRLRLIGAVINLFDSENVTDVCERVNGCGEFEMGDALSWQQPRRYELGLRFEF